MARRLYEGKTQHFIIDDRHQIFSLYSSKCGFCQHFQKWDFYCMAFPHGIPDKYLTGEVIHTSVDKDQIGDTVFTPK
ncbi:MAG: hypothetical protein JXR34_13110 [Bacteroidales bacterium]|nr:hypothetical protein [Bacteroidales bacterium]